MQTEEPAELLAAAENLPASQLLQARFTPALALYFPASHLSQARFTPALALYLPAAQLRQTDEPDVGEYFPAMQSVHTD